MIYVIYFFAVIGCLCCCSAVAITVIMVKQTIVNHKNDIDPLNFNSSGND